ncbi:MAG: TerC family protein [Ferrovum sp.]|nr:TerC family protein [Ferrovum sp.]NDU87677.1 TerC family protein [Ferrovum sp.]
MTAGFGWALGQIVAINLVLSGDNAVVIAAAAQRLDPLRRRSAVLWGSVGAVVLRIGLTFVAASLLHLPWVQTIGGIFLLAMGYRLVVPAVSAETHNAQVEGYWAAIRLILIADVIMSLDNVLTLAAVAQGDERLLIFGLVTSLPFVVVGSALLARLLDKYPFLMRVGGALLGQVGGQMILTDPLWHGVALLRRDWVVLSFSLLCAGVIATARRR